MKPLAGRVALVTGAGSPRGMGRAIVEALAVSLPNTPLVGGTFAHRSELPPAASFKHPVSGAGCVRASMRRNALRSEHTDKQVAGGTHRVFRVE